MPSATQGRRPQIEEFEFLGELGRGGLSTVHVAVSHDTGRRVAVKRVQLPRPDGTRASAFLADLTGATPTHPGALRPLATFVHDGEPWLVLRLMAGGSLRRYVGLVSPVQAARVLVSVLDVLHAAGRRGIAHADLKPENILLGPRGAVTVADFGLVAAHERARRCVVWGTRMATPAYMAPEQALGARATPAADLFAVGAVAYELLTGRPPLTEGEPLEELLRSRAHAPAPRLAAARPDLDPRLSAWVDGLMARLPEDRPSDAAEARERLEEIVADVHGAGWREESGLPPASPAVAGEESPMLPPAQRLAELPVPAVTSAPQTGPPPSAPAWDRQGILRRHPVAAWIALGLLVIAGVVAGAVLVLRSGSEPAPRARSTAPGAAAPLAASEYRRRGNAICAGQPALGDLFGAVRNPTQIRSVVVLALTSSMRPAIARLSALRPPPALLAAHRRALSVSRQETVVLQRLADGIAAGADPARATRATLPRLDRLEAQADQVFAELGLTRCARAARSPGAGA